MIKFPRLIWFEDAIHFPHFALLPVIYLLYSVYYIYITRMATAGSFAFRISSSSNPFFFYFACINDPSSLVFCHCVIASFHQRKKKVGINCPAAAVCESSWDVHRPSGHYESRQIVRPIAMDSVVIPLVSEC